MNSIKSLKLVFGLTALTALAACTSSSDKKSGTTNTVSVASDVGSGSSSIIGGVAVDTSDVINKSTVAIVVNVITQDNQQGQFLCTGSMIAPNIVLTAAHCVPGKEYKKAGMMVVFSNDFAKVTRDVVRAVTGVVVHPGYGEGDKRLAETIERLKKSGNPNGDGVELSDADQGADNNDIAILKINGTMAAGYQVAQILQDESVLKNAATVTLAGFGLTSVDKKPVNPKDYPDLEKAISEGQIECTYDRSACYILTNNNENILKKTDVQVTQGFGNTEVVLDQSQGKGACHGDSGGPAFININNVEYVWGVTSRGTGKDGIDDCSNYSIYTKVFAQSTFINAAMKQLLTPATK